jgi:UDP-N-acetylglucosamine acyltransferase
MRHATATIDPEASISDDVTLDAYVVIGPHVTIGAGCHVGPFTRIEGPTCIGERNHFYGHASIGGPPQGRKFGGEGTGLFIGDDNVFREFVTVHRGTPGGSTRIGSHNFFMAHSHIAHDCRVGSNTVFSTFTALGGHVEVGDFVTLGGFSGVHQFCRIGDHAFIGGGSSITQDVLPYAKTVGTRDTKTYGINGMGLERKGFSKDTIQALRRAYRILARSKLRLEDALGQIESDLSDHAEARYLVAFVRGSQRGVIR